MPNRILKESICTSEEILNLSPEGEIFFYRILVNCDDYGRMEARPSILRSRCYPLKIDTITDNEIITWLRALVCNHLIALYINNDKPYLQVSTWEKHQQIRAKRSKYPNPDGLVNDVKSFDSICNQLIAIVPVIQSNPIQSESNAIASSAIKCNQVLAEANVAADSSLPTKEKATTEAEFLEYVQETKKEFPELDCEVEFKRFKLYWSEGCRKLKRPKTAWYNWLVKAREIKNNGGHYGGIQKRQGYSKLPTTAELKASLGEAGASGENGGRVSAAGESA